MNKFRFLLCLLLLTTKYSQCQCNSSLAIKLEKPFPDTIKHYLDEKGLGKYDVGYYMMELILGNERECRIKINAIPEYNINFLLEKQENNIYIRDTLITPINHTGWSIEDTFFTTNKKNISVLFSFFTPSISILGNGNYRMKIQLHFEAEDKKVILDTPWFYFYYLESK